MWSTSECKLSCHSLLLTIKDIFSCIRELTLYINDTEILHTKSSVYDGISYMRKRSLNLEGH